MPLLIELVLSQCVVAGKQANEGERIPVPCPRLQLFDCDGDPVTVGDFFA